MLKIKFMIILSKKSCLGLILLLTSTLSVAQLSITGQVSGLKYLGDVGQKGNGNFFSDMRLGADLGIEYRIGKVLGLGINGMYGTLSGTDNDITSYRNFQSKIMGGSFNVFGFFDKNGEKEVAPYIHAGVGYLTFNPYGDLKDKNSYTYNYWKDGTIRNIPESTPNNTVSVILKRDYTYDTQLKDSVTNYARNTIYIPLGIGAKFQMGFRTSLRVGINYNLCLTDYLDNYKKGGNDSWAAATVGLNVRFGKKSKGANDEIDIAAANKSDSDNDGVNDIEDRCFGTPKGVKVDGKGCPVDTDDDGVADYVDKELESKKGALVDVNGVTIDLEATAKRQMEWDSLTSQRSSEFNTAPSKSYLKEVEYQSKEIKSASGKTSKIPNELRESDYNKDGLISADEITKTIDGFFEGANSFNVEKINKLIDYFFEQ